MTTSFCPQCGSPRQGGLRYCGSCSFDFWDAAQRAASPAQAPDQAVVEAEPARGRSWKFWAVGALVLVILAAIGTALGKPDSGNDGNALQSSPGSQRPQSDEPLSTPAPTPIPTPVVGTISDGDWIVGSDVDPGTYRTRSTAFLCYWERLSGFGGTLHEIIANGSASGYQVVTIAPTDKGFSTSGCSGWSADLSPVTSAPNDPITEDGIYIVGSDMSPGTWRSAGGDSSGCYAARLSGFGGTLDQVISNDLSSDGGLLVTIGASDAGFETTSCGTWTKVQ